MGRSNGKRVSKSVTKTRNVLLGESDYQISSIQTAKKDDELISFLISIQSDSRSAFLKAPVEVDLSAKILKDVDLFGINFTGSVWNGSELENVNFSNVYGQELISTNKGERTYPALFKNSSFDQTILNNVSFKKTTLDQVSFSSSALDQVDFSLSELKNIDFKKFDPDDPAIKITNSKFIMATLSDVNFQPGTVLDKTSFSGAQFLTMPKFKRTALSEVTFSNSDLNGATFHESLLARVIFSKVDLTHASFVGAGLNQGMFKNITADKEIDFSHSVIKEVHFLDSNLTKINLTDSDLIESTFENVDLTGVDLSHARFRDVVFNNCQLKGVRFAPGAPGIKFINCVGV